MPKRRQSKIPTPAWEKDHNVIGNRLAGRSPQFYALGGVIALVVVALGIVAYAVVSDEIEDRNRPGSTAVQVDDRKYSLEDFTTRVESFVQQNGGVGQITAQSYQNILPRGPGAADRRAGPRALRQRDGPLGHRGRNSG